MAMPFRATTTRSMRLNPYYNTAMPQRAYDPDKAAFHFKKAGLAAGTKIELQTSEGAWCNGC